MRNWKTELQEPHQKRKKLGILKNTQLLSQPVTGFKVLFFIFSWNFPGTKQTLKKKKELKQIETREMCGKNKKNKKKRKQSGRTHRFIRETEGIHLRSWNPPLCRVSSFQTTVLKSNNSKTNGPLIPSHPTKQGGLYDSETLTDVWH